MTDVFDDQGNVIASIPISEKMLAILETGADVTIIYHTPQRLRSFIGERTGSVVLRGKPSARVLARDPRAVKALAELQAMIAQAKQREADE
jgi:hypothetical protein